MRDSSNNNHLVQGFFRRTNKEYLNQRDLSRVFPGEKMGDEGEGEEVRSGGRGNRA